MANDIVDINVYETVETVAITVTPNLTTVNVNQVTGGGDMILANAQTNSGLKTFLNGTFGLRNIANTFTSLFSSAATAVRTYTLPNASGTIALTTDIPATPTLQQVVTAGRTVTFTNENGIVINISDEDVPRVALLINASNDVQAIVVNQTGEITPIAINAVRDAISAYSSQYNGIFTEGFIAGIYGLSTDGYGGKFQSVNGVAGYFRNNSGNTSNIAEFEGDDEVVAYIKHNGSVVSKKVIVNTTVDNGVDVGQFNGSIIASAIKKSGGTATQMLMADGSVTNLLTTFNGQSGTVTATATKGTAVYEFTGAGSLVLPTAIGNLAHFKVKNRHSANITVTFTGGQNADGTTTITLIPFQALEFISNNTNYNIY